MTTIVVPSFETERLILRAPRIEDFPACEHFIRSERSRFVGGPSEDRLQAWRSFAHLSSGWLLRGYGIFAMERRDSGTCIGAVGPWEPITWPEPELSWSIWDADAEGKGYVTEAMRPIQTWVFDTLGWTTCVSYIDPDNTRSIAVAERLGATLDPDAALPESADPASLLVYRHHRGDAE